MLNMFRLISILAVCWIITGRRGEYRCRLPKKVAAL